MPPILALSLSSIVLQGEERSGTTDEDSCPSSGSECQSRESSAGSVRSLNPIMPQLPPPTATPQLRRALRKGLQRKSGSRILSSLVVDIPPAAKTSRDSGLSSGDPSPNTSQSANHRQSPTGNGPFDQLLTTQLEEVGGGGALKHQMNRSQSSDTCNISSIGSKLLESRSKSAAMLTISPNRLREISDPIQQILQQLHKIIFISQLPPTLEPNPKRHMIEQYKRALFCRGSTVIHLKTELMKLTQGSREIIDLDLTLPDMARRGLTQRERDVFVFDADNPVTGEYDPDYKDVGITYEHMQLVIEETLVESGFYDLCVHPGNPKVNGNVGAKQKARPHKSPT